MRQDYVGKIALLCLATDGAGLLEEESMKMIMLTTFAST
jgi:hypothetical protein